MTTTEDAASQPTATPTAPPLLSIIIPVRNGAADIGQQLGALAAQQHDASIEVVVVDNGSTDGTAEVVRSWMARLPSLRLVSAPQATNVSQVRNIGARAATGGYFFWIDADDIIQPGWVAAMAAAATRYPAVGGEVDESSLNQPEVRGWRPARMTGEGLPRPFDLYPAPIGCNCGARRDVFEALGGFVDDWGFGGEEIDFFWRAQLKGYEVGYVPDAVVQYRFRTTIRGVWKQAVGYGRGNARLAATHRDLGIPRIAPGLPRYLGWLGKLAVRATASRQARGQLAYHLGHLVGQLQGSVQYRRLRLG